jgi:polyphosphate kinase
MPIVPVDTIHLHPASTGVTMNAPDLANDLLDSTGVVGGEVEVEDDGLPEDRYSDRELSWLAFNNRVLDLAKDSQRVPLLERAKFLAIFANNLDEFFMVRVAGLKRRIAAGVAVRTVSGLMPREVHQAILTRTRELADEHSRVFEEEIRPALAAEGIEILRWHELSTDEKDRMRELFAERIFPVLTPLAVDPSHPFPYISGLSINLAVLVKNPVTGIRQFARVKVPSVLPRFVKLDEGRFVALEDVGHFVHLEDPGAVAGLILDLVG